MRQQINFVNRSGHTLRGMLDFPEGKEKAPVLMNIHGFTGTMGGFKGAHTHMARVLAENGIACVRFDMYGNGESDGEFEDMTFTSLLEDTEDIYQWILKQPWADKEHVILSGQSMGGYVAACAAPKLQPAALVLMCPGAGMWYGALERAEAMEAQGIFEADIDGLRFRTAFNKDLHQYEPYSTAQGYKGPVLLLRGSQDELVDDGTCRKYCEVYGESCNYVTIENGNHNFSGWQPRKDCEDAIVKFLIS